MKNPAVINQVTPQYHVLFCHSDGQNLFVKLIKEDKFAKRKLARQSVWKNMGIRSVARTEMEKRKKTILADTNSTFHTKFKKIKIEVI